MNNYILRTNILLKNKKVISPLKISMYQFKKREIYEFIGQNGAGKSTMVRLVKRLTFPTSGSIYPLRWKYHH
ncbi:MAG: ATP-binding cassette domain-containing protein [Bacillota bacterium]